MELLRPLCVVILALLLFPSCKKNDGTERPPVYTGSGDDQRKSGQSERSDHVYTKDRQHCLGHGQ